MPYTPSGDLTPPRQRQRRISVYLDPETDQMLAEIAAAERLPISTAVCQIIRQHYAAHSRPAKKKPRR